MTFQLLLIDAITKRLLRFGTMKETIGIAQAQSLVDEWINTIGVRYFNELTNMALLTEEVGEVARIIARRYGEQSEKESDKNKDLGDEMADVLFVLLCLANQTGINLEEAFVQNMEKKTKRDADRHHQNPKLNS
jgi:NTP pyrophosphatase (non-canonical NTP hydrolase)